MELLPGANRKHGQRVGLQRAAEAPNPPPLPDDESSSSSDDDEEEAAEGVCHATSEAVTSAAVSLTTRLGIRNCGGREADDYLNDKEWMQEHLGDIFLSRGTRMSVQPGQAFLREGEPNSRVFLILAGTAVMRKQQADGSYKELEGLRVPGETVGELSFLLGEPPVVSVFATPPVQHSDSYEQLDICYIDRDAALALLTQQPRHARRFFWTLAVNLGQRVQRGYADMSSMLRSETTTAAGTDEDRNPAAALLDRAVIDVAVQFGIDELFATDYEAERALLATADCQMSVETNSASENDALKLQVGLGLGLGIKLETRARLYLFKTHLCIEQFLLGSLVRKTQAFELSHLLGIVNYKDDALHLATSKAVAGHTKTFDLQILQGRQGASIRLTMDAELSDVLARQIEEARILNTDLSQLSLVGANANESHKSTRETWTRETRSSSVRTSRTSRRTSLGGGGGGGGFGKERAFRDGKARATALKLLVSNTGASLVAQQQQTNAPAEAPAEASAQAPAQADPSPAGDQPSSLTANSLPSPPTLPPPSPDVSRQTERGSSASSATEDSIINDPRMGLNVNVGGVYADLGVLLEEDWMLLLRGAKSRKYAKGEKVLTVGMDVDGLMLCVSGSLKVQVKMPNRPRALVVATLNPGNFLGETSYLFGVLQREVVVDSEQALIIRLPAGEIGRTLDEKPRIAGKFFCFLAMRQAAKLHRLTTQEKVELTLPDGIAVPRTA